MYHLESPVLCRWKIKFACLRKSWKSENKSNAVELHQGGDFHYLLKSVWRAHLDVDCWVPGVRKDVRLLLPHLFTVIKQLLSIKELKASWSDAAKSTIQKRRPFFSVMSHEYECPWSLHAIAVICSLLWFFFHVTLPNTVVHWTPVDWQCWQSRH